MEKLDAGRRSKRTLIGLKNAEAIRLRGSMQSLRQRSRRNRRPRSNSKGNSGSNSNSRRSARSIDTFNDSQEDGETLKGLEAVRHAYLCDKRNHFLKCTMLTFAEIRSKKETKQTDRLLAYQEEFFKKRGKKPSIDDIISLGNAIKHFTNQVHKLYDMLNKKKISCFLKWKLMAFGYKKQLMKQLHFHFERKFELSYKRAKKLLMASRNRFVRKKFEAFSRWKSVVRLGFPLFQDKKDYKTIIFEVISAKNQIKLEEIPFLKKANSYAKVPMRTLLGMHRSYVFETGQHRYSLSKKSILFNSIKKLTQGGNKSQAKPNPPKSNKKSSSKSVTFNQNTLTPKNLRKRSTSKKLKSIIKNSASASKIKRRLKFTTPSKSVDSKKSNKENRSLGRSRSRKKKLKPPIPKFSSQKKKTGISYPLPRVKPIMSKYEPLDQVAVFKKLLHAFEVMRLRVECSYRDFFFRVKLQSYAQSDNNFGNRKIRGLSKDQVQDKGFFYILPRLMALHLFKNRYRMIIATALRKLMANVKFYNTKRHFKKTKYFFHIERKKLRMVKFMKIYIRLAKRRARRYIERWKMQKDLRKSVLANYSKIFDDQKNHIVKRTSTGFISMSQDTELYERVKKSVLVLSSKYSEVMTKCIAQNLAKDSHQIKKALNSQLNNLVNEILREII